MSKRPVVLVVMDGVGISDSEFGNAVKKAYKPTLDNLLGKNSPHTEIKAHGLAVGLPTDDDMGNSEVGHNALGCGTDLFSGSEAGKWKISKQVKSLKQKPGADL